MRTVAVALMLAVLLVSCRSGGEVPEQVQQDLEAQAEAQNALRSRIDELEEDLHQLRALLDEDVDTVPLLDELDQRVGQLESDLVAETTAREEAVAELRDLLTDLRGSLSSLESSLEDLRRELGDLRSRHNLLEQRFDSHERHPPG